MPRLKPRVWVTEIYSGICANRREDYPPSISISNPVTGQEVIEGRKVLRASTGRLRGLTPVPRSGLSG
jgi:hypothetical protein